MNTIANVKKLNLNHQEISFFKKLNKPEKIQSFLDQLAINFEQTGETCSSPKNILKRKSAHCMEAALFAAAIMIFHNKKPLLLDLKANNRDYDHVICLFKKGKYWGAISKSNHATLRYREPVYANTRELAMSYFHEYINKHGEKTLRSYSQPFSLKKYGTKWITADEDLWEIANEIDETKHYAIIPRGLKLRKADKLENHIGNLVEWNEKTGKMVKYK